MVQRVTYDPDFKKFEDCNEPEGHGRTGQIKKANWYESSVKIEGLSLNKGSLIDYLNAKLGNGAKPLSKSWFFRPSNEKIIKT
ncbi:MAG: hypothetical protein JSS09_03335, partial [Verrucomicrobia bacterium]|nr:hypothetical protein [Verrucomicrobiota bacterium]